MATIPVIPVGGLVTYATATVTTAADGLSDVIKIDGGTIVSITCTGTTWTAAALTFLGSQKTSAELQSIHHTTSMTELTYLTSGFTSGAFSVSVAHDLFAGYSHVQLRSGTKTAAVAQGSARTLLLGIVPYRVV
jgi:hypothetical protein